MMPIVIQLESSYRTYEAGFRHAADRSQWTGRTAACSPGALREEDAALRAAIALDPHLNVLVQCLDVGTGPAFEVMAGLCVHTPHVCFLPGPLDLPADDARTLLIGDVSTLTLQQQIDLHDWLERGNETVKVISLTSVPLWPLVTSGRFLEGLFYRLNVMSVSTSFA